ncbi:MAG TPA: hypothetical protein VF452_12260 [Candidatus Binatia bacterium]
MSNHVHLLIQTGAVPLSRIMQRLQLKTSSRGEGVKRRNLQATVEDVQKPSK